MDHQTQIMGKSNPTVTQMPRGNLEGWDFKDLATQEDPLRPRMCKIGTRGKSWIDLTRALCAPTLFGTGFGDLIKANDTTQVCPYWSKLPEGKSYLAVTDLDLSQIIDRHGNPNSKPIRLTDRLIWHIPPENDSRVCKCSVYTEGSDHSQLAQVILPSHFRKQIANQKHSPIKNWGNGAVVFGYNETMRWSWSDTGFPSQIDALSTDDSDSDSDSDDGFHDTAIGSSMRQSSTYDSINDKEGSSESEVDALCHDDYEVGIVCALWKELLAVRALFDLTHPEIKKDANDPNCYCVGRMAKFNVVAAGLPHDEYGMNSATAVTSHLIRTFPKVKFCLVVGIGGGVPSAAKDIRLGDVVVGTGVIQFDMGKRIQDSDFMMTGEKQQTPPYLRAVMTRIQSDCSFSFNSASNPLLNDIRVIGLNRTNYRHPGALQDILFEPDRLHTAGELNCDKCTGIQKRIDRLHSTPQVFYGLIASGNQVVRDAKHRDRLGRENVACFEMEGAGVVRSTADCLVIRGICDYSDSHKSKIWQEYAAATAAAYAKFFLSQMPRNDCDTSVRVPSQLGELRRPLNLLKQKRPLFSDDYSPSMLNKRQKY